MPNYNVMGVAKAALEASVRYLAADLGRDGIRVNAISAGPMRTLAGSAVGDARTMFKWNKAQAPLKINDHARSGRRCGAYLLSELAARRHRRGAFRRCRLQHRRRSAGGRRSMAGRHRRTARKTVSPKGKRPMRALRTVLTGRHRARAGRGRGSHRVWAGWQDTASQFDQQRLSRIDESRAKALAEAERGASATRSFDHPCRSRSRAARASVSSLLLGNWRCRTIKLGGITPDVIYTWFRCRISMKGGGPYLEKLTGSQYTNGYLYPDGNGSFVYLGGSSRESANRATPIPAMAPRPAHR